MDRRGAERVRADLAAHWEGVLARRAGTVVDLSLTGCFVLTADEVRPGELIRLEIDLPEGGAINLWGEVVYKIPEMGFGVRFNASDTAEEAALGNFISSLGGARAS